MAAGARRAEPRLCSAWGGQLEPFRVPLVGPDRRAAAAGSDDVAGDVSFDRDDAPIRECVSVIDLLVKSRIALGLGHCWWVREEFFTQLFVLSRFQLSGEGVYGLEGFWVVVPCIFIFTTPLLHALSVFEEGHEVGPPHANGSRSSGWWKVLVF